MRTYLDCYPCFVRQALAAARFAGADEEGQHRVLRAVLAELREFPLSSSSPEMAHRIHRLVRAETGRADPYREAKAESTRQALALYPELKARVAAADDPLEAAVRASIAGNIIDFGITETYDLRGTVERVLSEPFAIDDLAHLRADLARAARVLILGDNAGETVCDRLLIETLDRPVTYAVRGSPVLNDAVREDALAAGLDGVAEIVDNGSDAPATLLPLCSADFGERFAAADLILAKGQGNFESLSDVAAPLYFLLQAKCPVIARELGVAQGAIVLRRGRAAPPTAAGPVAPAPGSV